jgi:mono/diheme cytochrome c family protein
MPQFSQLPDSSGPQEAFPAIELMHRSILLALLLTAPLLAQDGGQLYTLHCGACHAPDGMGATGGQFPPLAGSPWVQGDADRMIKIVLHGLTGPVEVAGRTYNLEMPPQGSVLADDQLAAILTHVRASWDNGSPAVTPAMVKAARAATADRKTPWTAPEILKLHPLPAVAPPIANLISRIYPGEWQDLPDFSKLTPINVEEEHDGLISLSDADRNELVGLVWEGEITAPKSGKFIFRLDADDCARVIVNGKTVTEVRGIGPHDGSRAKQGQIQLAAGPHPIRIEYVEFRGQEAISLAMKGPGIPGWRNLSDSPLPPERPSLMVKAGAERAVVYRNFIANTTPRAIGIGFPGGVNLAYSADNLAPELIWTGDFIDGSRHWIDRGQGNQPPAGDQVVKLSGSPALSDSARFRGYKLDPAGNPTFSIQLGKQFVLDSWKPAGSEGSPSFLRTLTVSGQGGPVELLLSDLLPLKKTGDQDFDLGDTLQLHAEGSTLEARDGKTFIKLTPGQTATLTYRWK